MSKQTWLITGFEPFNFSESNSSALLVEELKQLDLNKYFATKQTLTAEPPSFLFLNHMPVSFTKSWAFLQTHLNAHPEISGVLALGQAETRSRVSLERLAVNVIETKIADNDGEKPQLGPVIAGGPDVLWSLIAWENMNLNSEFIERSYSAGTFVCNSLMYQLLKWAAPKKIKASFVHIPVLDVQAGSEYVHSVKMDMAVAKSSLLEILTYCIQE